MVMRVGKTLFAGIVLIIGLAVVTPGRARAAERVSFTPASLSLTEGQMQIVTVVLAEPLIAESGSAYLTLTITVSSPDRVTTSTSTLNWTQTQWNQPRTFRLDAIDDALVNGDVSDIINVSVDSNSEYYANFAPSFNVDVLDNDVTAPAVLPSVGAGLPSALALLLAVSSCGLVYMWQRRAKIRA